MAELPPFDNPPPSPEATPIGETMPQEVPPQESPSPRRWQGPATVLAWVFRWLLLGVGVGGAWILGILVAQFLPAPNPDPPLQEVAVRRTSRFVRKVRRLPDWWAGEAGLSRRPIVSLPPETAPASTSVPPPLTLSPENREQIAVELDAVQEGVDQLRDRTSALETQLGLPGMDRPLEERLVTVANRLSPPEIANPPEAPAQSPAAPVDTADPLFQVDAYRVTLPSDALFTPGETFLQTAAESLLDTLLLDIGRYPGATVLVGSYTDGQGGQSDTADDAYQQALAVQRYLSQRLGDDTYHWVAVGYGDTALGVAADSQLSRRTVIAIVP